MTGSVKISSETITDLFKESFPAISNAHLLRRGVLATTANRKWLRCVRGAASGRGLTERGNDVIDDFLDQHAIVALAHHADHGLRSG